jgi:hypothetical protein
MSDLRDGIRPMTSEQLTDAIVDLHAIAAAVGAIEAFVERAGTLAMKATCARARDACLRLMRWVDLQRAAPTPAPRELIDVLTRLDDLGELLEDVRAVCTTFLEERRLDRVAELADVFVSIDDVLDNIERELPAAS